MTNFATVLIAALPIAAAIVVIYLAAHALDAVNTRLSARTPRAQQQAACERLRAWVGRRA